MPNMLRSCVLTVCCSRKPLWGKHGSLLLSSLVRLPGPKPESLTGLGHISLLTNLSHRRGNTLFWFPYIWPLHLSSHIRGLECLEAPLHTKPESTLMDRHQICVITCVNYKNTYSAAGVEHTPGSVPRKHTPWVGGWSVERDKRWNWRREAEIGNFIHFILVFSKYISSCIYLCKEINKALNVTFIERLLSKITTL